MFVKNYPAMKIGQYLVVADMHIGISKDIYDSGIVVPKQSRKLADRINKLKRITRTKKLLLLGDVKHKVHGFSIMEKAELERFFEMIDYMEIVVVKGNHDGDIEKMLPAGRNIKVRKFFTIDEYFFTHGHRNIKTSKKLVVIGHNQPHVKFRDEMGAVYVEPVWIRGILKKELKGKTLIIMPAFNELCGATVINRDRMLGPVAKQLNKRKTHVYLLDGTDLGLLSEIKQEKK